MPLKFSAVLLAALMICAGPAAADLFDEVEHRYADNDGVRIHYVTVGEGPLVVMIHGFPDFWYSWRDQMDALRGDFQVVAIDIGFRAHPSLALEFYWQQHVKLKM